MNSVNYDKEVSIATYIQPMNRKFLSNYEYRDKSVDKWVNERDFTVPRVSKDHDKSWSEIKNYQLGQDPYVQSIQKIGEQILVRKRDREKDVSPREFIAQVPKDSYWGERKCKITSSIRSFKSISNAILAYKLAHSKDFDDFPFGKTETDQNRDDKNATAMNTVDNQNTQSTTFEKGDPK